MPQTLDPIPLQQAIVETRGDAPGAITLFFRQRWQQLQNAFGLVPTVYNPGASAILSAALGTTTLFTVLVGGQYRVSWSLARTQIDGAASSLQATIGWTEAGVAKTHVGRLMNTDTLAADPTDTPIPIRADASSDITIAIAYTSTTPGNMKYVYVPTVERLV
jgi:hypothetical protein